MHPWFSEESCMNSCKEFVNKHPIKDMDLLRKIATTGSLNEFRTLCNCLYVGVYTPRRFYDLPYEESIELRELCNVRFYEMLGDMSELYISLFRVWKSERWGGDESWRLFCDACKPSDEAKAILTIVSLRRYLGQILTVEILPTVQQLYLYGKDRDLYVESTYSFHLDIPSEFKEANRRRKEHVLRWRKFMSYIWDGDLDSGRAMIDRYDSERTEWFEKERRKNARVTKV